jgi:thioredoxin-dependent peroxiredoxin
MERKGVITFQGNPLTLSGKEVKVGDKAPEFSLLDQEMKEIRSGDFKGKIRIISVTPSLDTPVCDMQARRFNQEAASLSDDIVIVNISVDLPFAIARFCGAAGIDKVKALSDHKDVSFGTAYGVLIKELRLLARAVFVIDGDNVVRYLQIVPEITDAPDFNAALDVARKLIQK